MNEDQLKAFVRQVFSLQDTADRAVLDVDQLLGAVMLEVKRLVERLPDGSLLRNKTWRELEPLVKVAMSPYGAALRQAVYREEVAAAPEMIAYAAREATYAGATIVVPNPTPPQAVVIDAVDQSRLGKQRFRELFTPKQGPVSPWVNGMFKVVDQNVRSGILQGRTTKQIADDVVHETVSRGVKGVTLQGQTSVRRIRQQAMAMTRTVTQDVQRQMKEQLWDDNAEAIEEFVYQWSAALDSRCPSCATLMAIGGMSEQDAPKVPIHVNCRCQLLLIDPEDEFWTEGKQSGQQLKLYRTEYDDGNEVQVKTDPFKGPGAYKTPIKVKGEKFWRRSAPFTGNDYADYLAASNLTTQTQFFGGGPIGERRARYFRNQLDRMNKDPQQILQDMLTGPAMHGNLFRLVQ